MFILNGCTSVYYFFSSKCVLKCLLADLLLFAAAMAVMSSSRAGVAGPNCRRVPSNCGRVSGRGLVVLGVSVGRFVAVWTLLLSAANWSLHSLRKEVDG